jgi:hypothetical protein
LSSNPMAISNYLTTNLLLPTGIPSLTTTAR